MTRRPRALRRVLGRSEVRFSPGNRLTFYADGHEGLAAMLAAIESATSRIHLESYILRDDETGRRFADALIRQAARGVAVRVLCDGVGSRGLSSAYVARLGRAGIPLVVFGPLLGALGRFAPRRRDHRKILVVDGRVAFTGGLNIGDEYDRTMPPWRDAHFRVEGPAASDLEAVFLESWFRADGPDRPWLDGVAPGPPIPDGESVAVIADGPSYRRRRVRRLLTSALGRARSRVRIATPYFVPGRRLARALETAARRGLSVEILLAGRTDHPTLKWAARDRLGPLLAAGVRAFEYEPAMMHAKVAVFDGEWALAGTSNLESQSLERSYEVNLVIDGPATPGRLDAAIVADIGRAREITPETLAARGLLERLRDRSAALLLTRV